MKEKKLELWCNCQGESLVFRWLEDYEELFISHFVDSFYARQTGILQIVGDRIKNAWRMLWGKEFFAFEILIDKKQLQEFKDFIKEL
jgi:hypothetical protein